MGKWYSKVDRAWAQSNRPTMEELVGFLEARVPDDEIEAWYEQRTAENREEREAAAAAPVVVDGVTLVVGAFYDLVVEGRWSRKRAIQCRFLGGGVTPNRQQQARFEMFGGSPKVDRYYQGPRADAFLVKKLIGATPRPPTAKVQRYVNERAPSA